MFDWDAAELLYRELQRENIPMTIVTRWAACALLASSKPREPSRIASLVTLL